MLIIDKQPEHIMEQVVERYNVRWDTIKQPEQYLGDDVGKIFFGDGSYAWTMSSQSYVKNSVKNVKESKPEFPIDKPAKKKKKYYPKNN